MKRAGASGRLTYKFTNRDDIMRKLKLMHGEEPNNAAIAMFGKKSPLEIQMAVFATDMKHTFIDIDRAAGTLSQLVDIGEKYIRRNMRWRVVRDGSHNRMEIPEIPIDAVREALLNSYVHRDAKIPQTNEIAIYSDRIEIYNPGTFPEGLTPDDYINGSEPSVQRNPLLANILYLSKEIEKFGCGLQKIAKECEGAGVKFGFKRRKLGFTVIFYRTDISGLGSVEDNGKSSGTSRTPFNVPDDDHVAKVKDTIIECISENPYVTYNGLSVVTSLERKTLQSHIQTLKEECRIRRVGSDTSGHWKIVKLQDFEFFSRYSKKISKKRD
jgi:ATP-dependent DNA helicase RecG